MSKNEGLRRKAELKLHQRLDKQDVFKGEIPLSRMHELEVHQIELEMQNLELQQSKKALEIAHQKYADLFFDAPIGYMVCDENGLIEQANHALSELLEVDGGSMEGMAFASFASQNCRDDFYLHFRQTFKSDDVCSCEMELVSRTGTALFIMIESAVMLSHEAASKYIRSAVIDISQQKASEKKLALAIEKAELANRAKSDFLAVMSHELRTPLHGIIGLHNMLSKEVDYLQADHRQYLEMAQHASHVLQSLIEDVLDLSKIEANKVNVQANAFNLPTFLEDIRTIFVFQAQEKNLDLALVYEQLPDTIKADKTLIRQILINLIGNAIKFTDQGHVHIRVSYADELLSIGIEDSGMGIESAKLENLFEPFVQLSQHASRKGTGLGTTIALRLAQAMSGKINVCSTLGQGSTFILTLPVEDAGEVRISQSMEMANNGYENNPMLTRLAMKEPDDLRVLLAEDDDISRMIALQSLNDAHLSPDIAMHGLEAWDKVKSQNYDVLLTDIRMPGLDGIELTRRIRALEKEGGHRICIIGLSAHALEDVEQQCLSVGMDAFFRKPINPDYLLKLLGVSA